MINLNYQVYPVVFIHQLFFFFLSKHIWDEVCKKDTYAYQRMSLIKVNLKTLLERNK